MTDTPIYDQLIYRRDNPNWVIESYHRRLLNNYPFFNMERNILEQEGKSQDFIYEYQVNELKTRRRHDYDYHRDFKRKYKRKVYRSVVDWKV